MTSLLQPFPPHDPSIARAYGLRQCAKALSKTLLTTPAAWLLVCWMAWGSVPHGRVLAWLGYAVLARAVELALLRRALREGGSGQRLELALCAVAVLDGTTWGMTLFALMGFSLTLDPWLTALICCVAAINAPVYVTCIRAFGFLMGSMWLMILTGALLRPHRMGVQEQVFGVTIFLGLLAFHMPTFARHALRSIQFRFDNAALSDRLRETVAVVSAQATTDPLTGQPNRRALDDMLAVQARLRQELDRSFCVLLIDLDHFKQVNDRYGHLVGDDVLRAFVRRALEQLRQGDVCARYGGEEFVVVLPGTSLATAREVAERLRRGIAASALLAEPAVRATVSIGVAQCRADESALDLLERADAAVYVAKNSGRNRVHEAAA